MLNMAEKLRQKPPKTELEQVFCSKQISAYWLSSLCVPVAKCVGNG